MELREISVMPAIFSELVLVVKAADGSGQVRVRHGHWGISLAPDSLSHPGDALATEFLGALSKIGAYPQWLEKFQGPFLIEHL